MFWLCQGENGWVSSHNISTVWKDPVMCLRQRALKRRVLLSPASNCSCLQQIRKVSVLKREEMGRMDCFFAPGSWERQEHLMLKAENFAIKIKGRGSYFQQAPMSNTASSSINFFFTLIWHFILNLNNCRGLDYTSISKLDYYTIIQLYLEIRILGNKRYIFQGIKCSVANKFKSQDLLSFYTHFQRYDDKLP